MNEPSTLEIAPSEKPGEPPMKQLAPFDAYRAEAEKLKATAETLAVTSIEDLRGMALARSTRLALKEIRVAVEHRRKELGEHHLRETQRINADAAALRKLIEPLEARMLECEEFAEREQARLEDERRTARTAELTPFLAGPVAVDLGKLSEADYAQMLAGFREAHEARIAAAAKAEADRIAREKAETEERERIRVENERLKKEAVEREAAAKAEREAAVAALAAQREEAARIARQVEAEAKKLREEAAAKAAEAIRIAGEKARAEREAAEAREKVIAAALAAEKLARQKVLEEIAAKKQAAEKAAAAAAAAPDKAKLMALAETLDRALDGDGAKMTSPAGKKALGEIEVSLGELVNLIRRLAGSL